LAASPADKNHNQKRNYDFIYAETQGRTHYRGSYCLAEKVALESF